MKWKFNPFKHIYVVYTYIDKLEDVFYMYLSLKKNILQK